MSQELLLVQRAKLGDQDAFGELVAQYQKPIYNLVYRMTGNHQDAEELTQTAFLNAWRGLPAFQEESSFFTWLYRLAKNAAIDFLRKEARRSAAGGAFSLDDEEHLFFHLPDPRPGPEAQAQNHELRQALVQGIAALSRDHREIFLLREVDGLTYQEISHILFLETGTVKSRLARARLALRQILQEQGNLFPPDASDKTKIPAETTGGDAP